MSDKYGQYDLCFRVRKQVKQSIQNLNSFKKKKKWFNKLTIKNKTNYFNDTTFSLSFVFNEGQVCLNMNSKVEIMFELKVEHSGVNSNFFPRMEKLTFCSAN